MSEFRDELTTLLNRHSMENGSDTPDFVLAAFLAGVLGEWDVAVAERERWYGRKLMRADLADLKPTP